MGTNIILIGFMGTGKTTVGKLLAKTLQYPFIDLDEKIEADNGMTIPKIFEERGESYFRAREKDAVREIRALECHVISTGGGTPVDAENAAMLREAGFVVSLHADIDTIAQRTSAKGERPVLDGAEEESRRKVVERVLASRKEAYSRADICIDTAAMRPREAVHEIICALKEKRNAHA